MELHRFFRYAIEKMCKEKKSLNHFKKLGDRKHSNINYLFVSSQETGAGRNNATGTAPV